MDDLEFHPIIPVKCNHRICTFVIATDMRATVIVAESAQSHTAYYSPNTPWWHINTDFPRVNERDCAEGWRLMTTSLKLHFPNDLVSLCHLQLINSNGNHINKSSGLSVSLAGTNGRVLGSVVAGSFFCAPRVKCFNHSYILPGGSRGLVPGASTLSADGGSRVSADESGSSPLHQPPRGLGEFYCVGGDNYEVCGCCGFESWKMGKAERNDTVVVMRCTEYEPTRTGKKVAMLKGKWDEAILGNPTTKPTGYDPMTEAVLPWDRDKTVTKTRYNLTPFAISLNEIIPGLREKLPPTDSRLTLDQGHLQNGEYEIANAEKIRLEQLQ
ncbi:Oxysterol-binding protein [Artemisia annua]|uniref:Oxysterol-binding protein n=1 Tax=Artemisia annua TaxID=35608 RepID=A0A2U1NYS1_ARTAN|nr:Oxysterol-binding protein [Artemisia annua]